MRFNRYCALPLCALANPVWGQADVTAPALCSLYANEDNGEVIGCQITVVGTLPTSMAESSEAVTTIVRTHPNRPLPERGRLENILGFVAGLQQFRRSDARSANPTSQGVTLRGLGGNASSRALLMLDGVPQADPFGGWVSWPGYDALNLASVRIRRGGGQPSAGPGALAGVIELDSRQWPLGEGRFNLAYGSRNSVDAKAVANLDVGGGLVGLSGSYVRSDGFIPVIAAQRGSVDRPAPFEQAGLNLRAVADLSEGTELQFNLRGFVDKRDRGFDFSENENSGVDGSIRLVHKSNGWQWTALAYAQLREFSSRFASIASDRNSLALTLDQYATPSTGLGARFEVRPPLGDDSELKFGGDWRRSIGETQENSTFTGLVPGRNRNAGGSTDSFGLFAEASHKLSDQLTANIGGRLDGWRIADGFRREIDLPSGLLRSDDHFADRSGTEWSGRAGLAWTDVNSGWTVRSAAYAGWRLPTLNELYRPFRVGADAVAANELLEPERLTGAEAGIDFKNDDAFSFFLTAFWNRLDNAIANVTLANGPGTFPGVGFVSAAGTYSQRRNLDAIESRGVELDASYDLTDIAGMNFGYENLTLRASYAYVDAKVEASGVASALNGLRPAQVPRHFASLSLDYDDRDDKSAHVSLRYVGNQYEDDRNTQLLSDAITVDAGLGYNLSPHWKVEVRAENLFDAEVQAAISSAGIIERASPRTVWVGVRWNFE